MEKLNNCWEELQHDVNNLLSKDTGRSKEGIGLKEVSFNYEFYGIAYFILFLLDN